MSSLGVVGLTVSSGGWRSRELRKTSAGTVAVRVSGGEERALVRETWSHRVL